MDYSKMNTLKLDINNQIIIVLSDNSEITNKISEFKNSVDKLISNHKNLVDLYAQLSSGNNSSEKHKNEMRNHLVKAITPVVTILQIYAFDKNRKNLFSKLESLSFDFLDNCSDTELINISKKIWQIANKHGGYSLAFISKSKSSYYNNKLKVTQLLEKDYGLIPAMINDIEEANIKFIKSLLTYKEELKGKEKIIGKIKKYSNETGKILKNKIDLFVNLVKNDNPDFYNNYRKAREYQNHEITTEDEAGDTSPETKNIPAEDNLKQAKRVSHGRLKPVENTV